ncbi:MAG TPA: metallophosphoesterase [candidate division WOR-3 bacterium]|uniref:Metallophosphoesterase n=1 Tax=candidate division WOR-3 bacterium TaxID=2052148 RepID=A0A9C9EL38_UNCW3|nr:metallophosphoesterase [candidate division WOR-3 bacterium]
MKAAIISDIHSNLEALQAVVKDIKKRRIKNIFCLGDLVGYGANPNECIELCLKEAKITIAGNHDWAAIDKTDVTLFNPVAAEAIRWTQEHTSSNNLARLRKLKLMETTANLFLVHASPGDPSKWNYLFSLENFKKQFRYYKTQICFIGHSHIPGAVFQDANGYTDFLRDNPFPLLENRRYIVNVGSVGQPRDLDPRASYAIYDGNKKTIEIVRLDYNIPLAQQKVIDAGLPESLADRLLVGR